MSNQKLVDKIEALQNDININCWSIQTSSKLEVCLDKYSFLFSIFKKRKLDSGGQPSHQTKHKKKTTTSIVNILFATVLCKISFSDNFRRMKNTNVERNY